MLDCGSSDAFWHYPWGLEMKPFKGVKAFVKTKSDTFAAPVKPGEEVSGMLPFRSSAKPGIC